MTEGKGKGTLAMTELPHISRGWSVALNVQVSVSYCKLAKVSKRWRTPWADMAVIYAMLPKWKLVCITTELGLNQTVTLVLRNVGCSENRPTWSRHRNCLDWTIKMTTGILERIIRSVALSKSEGIPGVVCHRQSAYACLTMNK